MQAPQASYENQPGDFLYPPNWAAFASEWPAAQALAQSFPSDLPYSSLVAPSLSRSSQVANGTPGQDKEEKQPRTAARYAQ